MDQSQIDDIREATYKAWALGNDECKDRMQRLLERQARLKLRGSGTLVPECQDRCDRACELVERVWLDDVVVDVVLERRGAIFWFVGRGQDDNAQVLQFRVAAQFP